MNSTQPENSQPSLQDLPPPQRRIIRAWCMYDWANSAFATSGIAAIIPVYFVFLFKESLGEEATLLGLTLTGSSVWSLAIVVSVLTVALTSPILGILSDRLPIKKTLLWIFTIVGSLFTFLIFFSAYTGHPWAWLLGAFILANVGFTGSLVFYNAFLPHVAPRRLWDNVSSRGFAYGYAGGGILLVVHLVLILATQDTAYEDLAARAAIASIGLWWFAWALWTLLVVPEPPVHKPTRGLNFFSAISLSFSELRNTARQVKQFRVVLNYLVSYLLFNDGIQTVLVIAGAFAADTLGIGLAFNMATIAIIQFVAVPSAMAFSWLAYRTSTKAALGVALLAWIVIVLFGVALAPLTPTNHSDHDFQLNYDDRTNEYQIAAVPGGWDEDDRLQWQGSDWPLQSDNTLRSQEASDLPQAFMESPEFKYSLSFRDGPMNGQTALGPDHPSIIGSGPIGWWPSFMRSILWKPLGIDVGFQWLILGVLVGLIIGGSQALARSLFAQITPSTRSGEFFAFFGFMSRASSVLGPILYILATSLLDTRAAVTAILIIIIAGAILLRRVDVEEGARAAQAAESTHLSS